MSIQNANTAIVAACGLTFPKKLWSLPAKPDPRVRFCDVKADDAIERIPDHGHKHFSVISKADALISPSVDAQDLFMRKGCD